MKVREERERKERGKREEECVRVCVCIREYDCEYKREKNCT